MQSLEISGAVRPLYGSLGLKGLNEVPQLDSELTCGDFAIWRLLPDPHFQMYEPNLDVHVAYSPSLILTDTI